MKVYVLEHLVKPNKWKPIASCVTRKPLGKHVSMLLDSGFVRSELMVREYGPARGDGVDR